MRLGAFLTLTDPIRRQDPYLECINMACDLCDQIVIVDGGHNDGYLNNLDNPKLKIVERAWLEEFSWEFIGENFNFGYENCDTDWVVHLDADFFFYENDFEKIRKVLEENNDKPAVSFWKYQFLLVDRYRLKSRLVIAVNKGKFGDRIKFNSGGDLCQPSLDGMELKPDAVPEARIPFYNYDACFKNKEVIAHDFHRMAKARNKVFSNDNWGIESKYKALEFFKRMQTGRFNNNSGWEKIPLEAHPKYIRERIRNILPIFKCSICGFEYANDWTGYECPKCSGVNEYKNIRDLFGYNMFGWIKEKAYE